MRVKVLLELLWKSHRGSLILLVILLVSNVFISVYLDQFLVPKVAAEEGRYLKRQTEVRKLLRNQGGTAETPEQRYVLASQDLEKFQQTVPEYLQFTGLIEELLVLSSRAQLNITQISYTSEQLKESPLLKFNLNFNVAGDYGQLKKFIYSLEQSTRLISLEQISLESADEDGVKLGLKLVTLFRPGSRES